MFEHFRGPAEQRAPPRARKAAGHIRAPSQNQTLASLLHATCEPQHKEYASRDLALALPQSQVLLRFAGALTDGHGAEERMNGVPRYLVRKGTRDWMVWDRDRRAPARLEGGRPAVGLSEEQAREIRDELTQNLPFEY